MIRTALLLIAMITLLSVSVRSQTGPDPDHGRFTFKDVPEGLLRLDNRSGQVSICGKRPGGWACEASADDRAALETEIGRLQAENAKLKRELLARGSSMPDGMKPENRSSKSDELRPGDPDLDRVMAFLDRVWRRLIDLVQNLQKERDSDRKDMRSRETDRRELNGIPFGPPPPRKS